ncbi:ABC transporter substrate-binding protein [soil metagenome]
MTYGNPKIHFVSLILAFAAVMAFGACAQPKSDVADANFVEVKDDLGRTVNVPNEVNRLISLAPSITELVFSAGAGDKLVGVTSYCDYPAEASSIRKVGDTQTPNVEAIVALRPQLVLVSTASQLEAFADVLNRQNIGVFVVDVQGLEDVPQRIRTLGEILGTKEQADVAADAIAHRIDAVISPKVFVQISAEPLFTIGSGSFITELVRQAGGDSVTKDIATGYPKLSKETAAAMNPDVIVLSDSEDNREPNEVFRNSPAVRNGRVYRIDADILSRPGPRLVDAVEKLAEAFHGKGEVRNQDQ